MVTIQVSFFLCRPQRLDEGIEVGTLFPGRVPLSPIHFHRGVVGTLPGGQVSRCIEAHSPPDCVRDSSRQGEGNRMPCSWDRTRAINVASTPCVDFLNEERRGMERHPAHWKDNVLAQ
jgi:hypothetical protein